MAFDFTAKDLFEMAKQIERNGSTFYMNASKTVTGDREKQMFFDLAKMEEQHEQTFMEMEADLNKKEAANTVFDPDNEAALYLKSLADTQVFFEKDISATTLKSILKYAISAEKDSIVFYMGMKALVPRQLGKKRIDVIIKEEMGHIRMLSNELVTLK